MRSDATFRPAVQEDLPKRRLADPAFPVQHEVGSGHGQIATKIGEQLSPSREQARVVDRTSWRVDLGKRPLQLGELDFRRARFATEGKCHLVTKRQDGRPKQPLSVRTLVHLRSTAANPESTWLPVHEAQPEAYAAGSGKTAAHLSVVSIESLRRGR